MVAEQKTKNILVIKICLFTVWDGGGMLVTRVICIHISMLRVLSLSVLIPSALI